MQIIIAGNEEVIEKLEQFDTNGGMEFRDNYGNEKKRLKSVSEGVTLETVLHNYVYKRFSTDKENFNVVMKNFGMIVTTYSADVEMIGGSMSITEYSGKPNKRASIVKMSAGGNNMVLQRDWFNGESGGSYVAMGGTTPYAGDTLERKKMDNFPLPQYYYAQNKYLDVELLGIDEIDGVEYYKVRVQVKGQEDFGYEYYSVETGWLVMEENYTMDPEGNPVVGAVKYDDWKEVKKGYMAPHKMILEQPGMTIEANLESCKVGKKPKSKAFDGVFK